MEYTLREDKISLLRRSFGVLFLSIAFLITAILLDYFHCTFEVFNDSCGTGNNTINQNIFETPLPVGIFFITILTLCGSFFGFFHGRQSVGKGNIYLENFLCGIRFRRTVLANLSLYNEIRVTSSKAFGQMTYHIIVRVPEKEVQVLC